MSNYRRLISYIYSYEGGEKGKNIGYAKIEVRNGHCKIHVNVKSVFVGSSDIGVYMLAPGKEVLLGKIFVRGGTGEFRTNVQADNVENSGVGTDDCYGLTIHDVANTWQCYTTIWDDAVSQAAELQLAEVTSESVRAKEAEKNEPKERTRTSVAAEIERELEEEDRKLANIAPWDEAADTEAVEMMAAIRPAVMEGKEKQRVVAVPEQQEREQRQEQRAPQMPNQRPPQMPNQRPPQVPNQRPPQVPEQRPPQMPNQRPPQMPNQRPPQMPNQRPPQVPEQRPPQMPNQHSPRVPEQRPPQMPNQRPPQVQNQQSPQASEQRPPQVPNQRPPQVPNQQAEAELTSTPLIQPGANAATETQAQQEERINTNATIPEPENLEQLEALDRMEQEAANRNSVWDRMSCNYTKVLAFDYDNGCEILSIKPQDIGLLPREIWTYGNNSFLLHGYYNYRHLILAKLNNPQGEPRYLLGVPGHYFSNEKYMASMFGFPHFVLAKKQPEEDGRFGYWYTDIRL